MDKNNEGDLNKAGSSSIHLRLKPQPVATSNDEDFFENISANQESSEEETALESRYIEEINELVEALEGRPIKKKIKVDEATLAKKIENLKKEIKQVRKQNKQFRKERVKTIKKLKKQKRKRNADNNVDKDLPKNTC